MEIPVSNSEKKADEQTQIPNPKIRNIEADISKEESVMQTISVVDLMKDMHEPTKLRNSKAHQLLMKDIALSNYPSTEYAEMMALFMKSAGMFLVMGFPQIAAFIIYDRQNVEWSLQGVNFELRKWFKATGGESKEESKDKQSEIDFRLKNATRV